MYTVRWAPGAASAYDELSDNDRQRVDRALFELANDPVSGAHAKKLHGELAGLRSARAGRALRLIYTFEPESRILNLLVLAPRRDAY